MTGDEKKKRDPIFTACFIVFLLAAVGVIGVFVDEHFLTSDDTKAAYGDDVTVNYTGTFYAYYGEEYAVVFDTSYRSVGENDSIIKSNSFSRTSYGSISFTIGDGDYLQAFEEAVVGHKAGDKVQVMIPNAYPAGSAENTQSMSGLTIPTTQRMTATQFESVYDYDVSTGSTLITTVYGWPAMAYAEGNNVVIINMPESGQTYTYTAGDEDEETGFGTTTFRVTGITDSTIVYTIGFEHYTTVDSTDGEIQMIELAFGNETWYVTNVDGSQFTYKTCDETRNIDLYFEIEIVSVN